VRFGATSPNESEGSLRTVVELKTAVVTRGRASDSSYERSERAAPLHEAYTVARSVRLDQDAVAVAFPSMRHEE
jgi:hypothetical protein